MTESYDTLFLSDTHLSTYDCNSDDVLDFLFNFEAPVTYILGDYIDLWKLQTFSSWPDEHTKILEETLQRLHSKLEIKYIVGNHDEFFEKLTGKFQGLTIAKKDILEINGKKLLVVHGHQFDFAIKYFKLFAILGTGIYDWLTNAFQKADKLKPDSKRFSLKEYIKDKSGKVGKYKDTITEYVKKKGLDGVICGHTHEPDLYIKNDLIYANTGDFVSNSSFIAKKENKLILMKYDNHEVITVKELKV